MQKLPDQSPGERKKIGWKVLKRTKSESCDSAMIVTSLNTNQQIYKLTRLVS